jgi:hypothetical protein
MANHPAPRFSAWFMGALFALAGAYLVLSVFADIFATLTQPEYPVLLVDPIRLAMSIAHLVIGIFLLAKMVPLSWQRSTGLQAPRPALERPASRFARFFCHYFALLWAGLYAIPGLVFIGQAGALIVLTLGFAGKLPWHVPEFAIPFFFILLVAACLLYLLTPMGWHSGYQKGLAFGHRIEASPSPLPHFRRAFLVYFLLPVICITLAAIVGIHRFQQHIAANERAQEQRVAEQKRKDAEEHAQQLQEHEQARSLVDSLPSISEAELRLDDDMQQLHVRAAVQGTRPGTYRITLRLGLRDWKHQEHIIQKPVFLFEKRITLEQFPFIFEQRISGADVARTLREIDPSAGEKYLPPEEGHNKLRATYNGPYAVQVEIAPEYTAQEAAQLLQIQERYPSSYTEEDAPLTPNTILHNDTALRMIRCRTIPWLNVSWQLPLYLHSTQGIFRFEQKRLQDTLTSITHGNGQILLRRQWPVRNCL